MMPILVWNWKRKSGLLPIFGNLIFGFVITVMRVRSFLLYPFLTVRLVMWLPLTIDSVTGLLQFSFLSCRSAITILKFGGLPYCYGEGNVLNAYIQLCLVADLQASELFSETISYCNG